MIYRNIRLAFLIGFFSIFSFPLACAQESEAIEFPTQTLAPLTERFILDEVKNLRIEQEQLKKEILQSMIEQERSTIDRALSYSTNTVNYFFFLITVVIGILALFGWRTLQDLKNSARSIVEKEAEKLLKEFRNRLEHIEQDLTEKGKGILQNQHELERLQRLNALWSEAEREKNDHRKLDIMEEIREIEPQNAQIYVTKASCYLRLGLPEQALEMCEKALHITPDQASALYNSACAYAQMGEVDEAIKQLHHAISIAPKFVENAEEDSDFDGIRKSKAFKQLLKENT